MLNKDLEVILESIIINHDSGFKLPSEAEIMRKYKVSRTTVRNTLKKLITKNMIYGLQGKGYFIL